MTNVNNMWKKRRRIEYLQKRESFYIFTEGQQTEPNYFQAFKKIIEQNPIYKSMIYIDIQPCQAETLRVLKNAEVYIKEHNIKSGSIWCVYDKDDFPNSDYNSVVYKILNLNNKQSEIQYHAIWSNQCFEFWYLLHFENYTSNTHRNQYYDFLNHKLMMYKLGKYEKNSTQMFDILLDYGNPKKAIRFAKNIIARNKQYEFSAPHKIAPGTKVYELVEALVQYFPEDIKTKFI